MIRPRVREEDLLLVLDQVAGEAQAEANGQWFGDAPSEGVLRVLYACKRIRGSVKRSVAGVRAYETAKERGNLPPVLTRVQGYTLDDEGRVQPNDDGKPVYVFQRRQ